MSAIWGIIDLNNNILNKENNLKMLKGYEKCLIDKYSYKVEDNIILGCGIQYITIESEKEELPYFDKSNNIFFTADTILDNREELINIFKCNKNITDSQLMYKAFLKWGEEFPKYILGSFTYVIYNKNKNEILCGRDHVGSRSIYFSFENGVFYFSTIIKPILLAKNKKIKLNKRWLNDFIAIEALAHTSECKETIYKDIYQIQPSEKIKITKNNIYRNDYWNPIKDVKELKLKTDEEYGELFRNTLNECVKSAVRTKGNVGVMLSGGLDSSAISYYASKNVNNKIIQGYTSVPLESYDNKRNKYFIVDERDTVQKFCNELGNINPNFCSFDNEDSYSTIEEIIDILETPYKIIQNAYWINEVYKKANLQKCRVLLNGQYGNATISFGNILIHLNTLISKGKFLTFNREMSTFCFKRKIGRKSIFNEIFKNIIPFFIKIGYNNKRRNNVKLINPNLYKAMNTKKRFIKLGLINDKVRIKTLKKSKHFIFNKIPLSQIGEIETKMSLYNNFIIRDPSRDKRMIELCLSLPTEQFVKNGTTRRLIRDHLKGYLPDYITTDNGRRGLQSADWYYRLNKRWGYIYNDIKNNLSNDYIYEYINKDYTDNALKNLKEGINENNEFEAVYIISASILSIYINNIGKISSRGE